MKLKKLFAVIMMAVLVMSLAACGGDKKSSTAAKPTRTPRPTFTPVPEGGGGNTVPTKEPEYDYSGSDKVGDLTGMTSNEVVAQMGFGINIGNSFDSTGGDSSKVLSHEVSWGNPEVTQEYIDAVYEAGFRTVRIPTTWANFIKVDNGTYTIYPAYINRVREVVDYCYQHDMFVILNIHHEAWLNNDKLVTKKDAIATEIEQVWTQIADAFADYDQHLIFETMNEPRLAGTNLEWSGNPEAYEVINYFNQIITNVIRKSGKGHNDERCIMIPQYAASNSGNILEALSMPTYNGEVIKNLIVSVHSYTPYDFCLQDAKDKFDDTSSSDTAGIDYMYKVLKSEFLDNGIPVVIGETSATNTKNNHEDRARWASYMGKMGASYGTPLVLWDNGNPSASGGESHVYIDRYKYTNPAPQVTDALLAPLKTIEWGSFSFLGLNNEGSSSNDKQETVKSIVDGNVIVNYADGNASKKEWDSSFIQTAAKESYFMGNKDIYVAYKGAGRVVMILDSEELQEWWIPVDQYETKEINGYKVQIFKGDEIKKAMEKFNVKSYSQLRNLSFVSADGDVTAYEVSYVGDGHSVVFKVNGATYAMTDGSEMPENPEVTGLKFLGWYTTKTFDAGSEYKGGTNLDEDITVYAKLGLDK